MKMSRTFAVGAAVFLAAGAWDDAAVVARVREDLLAALAEALGRTVDDIMLADLLDPAITVIAQDPARIGRTAGELLFRRLDGDRSPTRHHVVPTRLIVRGSGEIPPPG